MERKPHQAQPRIVLSTPPLNQLEAKHVIRRCLFLMATPIVIHTSARSTVFRSTTEDCSHFNANRMQAARPAAQYQPTSRIEDSVRQSEDPQFSQRRLVSRRILDIAFFPAASHNKFVHSHDLHDRYGLLFVGNDGAFLPPGLIISTTKNFILIILDLIEWRWFGPFIPEESVAYVPSYVVSGV